MKVNKVYNSNINHLNVDRKFPSSCPQSQIGLLQLIPYMSVEIDAKRKVTQQ